MKVVVRSSNACARCAVKLCSVDEVCHLGIFECMAAKWLALSELISEGDEFDTLHCCVRWGLCNYDVKPKISGLVSA